MEQHAADPFFEQLKADVQEGIDAADRGELVDAEVVWQEMRERIDEIEKNGCR